MLRFDARIPKEDVPAFSLWILAEADGADHAVRLWNAIEAVLNHDPDYYYQDGELGHTTR